MRNGMTNREIARVRATGLGATKFRVAKIIRKLDVDTRVDLRRWRGSTIASDFSDVDARNEGGTAMSDELKRGALG